MPIRYPSWLPLAQRASKNLTFQTPFRQDVPAVGAPIFQKLTTDVATSWSLTWIFTSEQERAFMQWLRSSKYLNSCTEWFTMSIDLGGSGLQTQTLHFVDYPVQTNITGGVVTWTGNVIAKKLNNTMDEFDDVLVELDYRWYSWLDEVVNRELPQVYMTPILHMPINMLSSTLDSRIVYDGPQVYYINRNGNLVQSAANEWPLTYIDGKAVGRVPPEAAAFNGLLYSDDLSQSIWAKVGITVAPNGVSPTGSVPYKATPTEGSGTHEIVQKEASSLVTGDMFTTSVFFKAAGNTIIQLRFTGGATGTSGSYHNFDTATLQTRGDALSSSIIPVGNGWFRASATVQMTGRGVIKDVGFGVLQTLSLGRRPTWTGDGINGLLIWGAQIEKGAYPSSFIPTTGGILNRAAESARVVMNGAASVDVTYSDGTVVNVPSVDDYATIPQADSAWGSKYITTIKFNV